MDINTTKAVNQAKDIVNHNDNTDEKIALQVKLAEATAGLGKSLSLLEASHIKENKLKAQITILEKENEQYREKINHIKNTWYGIFALFCYRILQRGKRFVCRTAKKG